MKTVILANGKFPKHQTPLRRLNEADVIVCCDGATANLIKFGLEPTAIVGDLDSLSEELKEKFRNRLFHNPDQNTNDLTKATLWCEANGYKNITILGATGLREDHTLGNIGLLTSYATRGLNVEMVTDYGVFTPICRTTKFQSFLGQAVSVFSQNNETLVSTKNLEYPINKGKLTEYWMGTLNRSLGDWFEVELDAGSLIIFQSF
ncbi:MAG TPA: thiamine diphosphokinase [Tenuifilaceae bacterium]|nr:thiamine diphosphokinase [Tenuifilaceae bacterium]